MENFVKFGRAFFEMCELIDKQTDRHTNRDADHNNSYPTFPHQGVMFAAMFHSTWLAPRSDIKRINALFHLMTTSAAATIADFIIRLNFSFS